MVSVADAQVVAVWVTAWAAASGEAWEATVAFAGSEEASRSENAEAWASYFCGSAFARATWKAHWLLHG